MTEPDTEEVEIETDEQRPQMNSYQISATRVFEVDYSEPQIADMKQRTGADTAEEAIEISLLKREKTNVLPQEKLLAVDVQSAEMSE